LGPNSLAATPVLSLLTPVLGRRVGFSRARPCSAGRRPHRRRTLARSHPTGTSSQPWHMRWWPPHHAGAWPSHNLTSASSRATTVSHGRQHHRARLMRASAVIEENRRSVSLSRPPVVAVGANPAVCAGRPALVPSSTPWRRFMTIFLLNNKSRNTISNTLHGLGRR
jgi:hypothetical protein